MEDGPESTTAAIHCEGSDDIVLEDRLERQTIKNGTEFIEQLAA